MKIRNPRTKLNSLLYIYYIGYRTRNKTEFRLLEQERNGKINNVLKQHKEETYGKEYKMVVFNILENCV